jgi:hypothetical protein
VLLSAAGIASELGACTGAFVGCGFDTLVGAGVGFETAAVGRGRDVVCRVAGWRWGGCLRG